jgi:N-acetyl-gamma-glutamyl-phosphate reductase
MPEIDQVLSDAAGAEVRVIFTPHLIPMDRGILSTCYAVPTAEMSSDNVVALLRRFYADEPFVRVTDALPSTKQVAGTNFCDLTARTVRGRVVVLSAIDNLVKGASGAAVQNFNLMHGIPETMALI